MNPSAFVLVQNRKSTARVFLKWNHTSIRALIVCLALGQAASSAMAAGLQRRIVSSGSASGSSPSGASTATGGATGSAGAGTIQAAQVTSQSLANLTASMRAIAAQQAAQIAAQNTAQGGPDHLTGTSDVPDGLSTQGAGGLVPDSGLSSTGVANPVTSWVNAGTPTQTTANGETTVTTVQTGQYALLNWSSFNIGKNTTLVFDQSAGGADAANWVALNKINDPNDVPSQILGAIKAQGQVYVINQSGIIFGGSSQVNVHTLIASALDLNDPGATLNGVTYAHYTNYLSGNGILSSGTTPQPDFTSANVNGEATSPDATVDVEAGAQITASGGDVLILAPHVQNDGAIVTPAGQTLLVGGSDAVMTTGDSFIRGLVLEENSSAPNPNGGDNYSTTPGTVVNNGLISASEGNITVVAGSINQNGIVLSDTSTTENGSINLDAETGDLVLGGVNDDPIYAANGIAAQVSVVQILPDSTDQSQITDSQAVSNSSVALQGVNVDVRGIVQLRGFDLTNANNHDTITQSLFNTTADIFGGLSIVATGESANGTVGNVLLESGSLLDTAGMTDATASASRNSVAVELRANELADSPVIEAGPLYQQTIYVDSTVSGTNADGTTWQGTPLANASGWIGLTTRSLDERLMNAAPITIAGGTVANPSNDPTSPPAANLIQQANSMIDISGGLLTYTAGFVRVSELITASGTEINASSSAASSELVYTGIADAPETTTDAKWGITQTRTPVPTGYNDPGYVQGGSAGTLDVIGNTVVLGGNLNATVVVGEKQRTIATAPAGATLDLGTQNMAEELALGINFQPTVYSIFETNTITVSDAATATASQQLAGMTADTDPDSILPSGSTYVSASWLNEGLGTVSLGANEKISIQGDINLLPGGSLSLTAQTVDVENSITAPGGSITMTGAYTITSLSQNTNFTSSNGSEVGQSGVVNIGDGVTLSTAGLWVNDALGSQTESIATSGGTISLSSYYGNVDLSESSVLDVSAGGYETTAGAITVGSGGTINLIAGLVPSKANPTSGDPWASAGMVNFNGTSSGVLQAGQLLGYGAASDLTVGKGGTLNLKSDGVATIVSPDQAGGNLITEGASAIDDGGFAYTPLTVSTDFFSSGGFDSVNLTAQGIDLPASVTLAPAASSLLLPVTPGASAASLADVATPTLFVSGLRSASSIGLHSTGDALNHGGSQAIPHAPALTPFQESADLAFYGLDIAGTIVTDPKGSITLAGDQIAAISGTVDAPSGSISLSGGTDQSYVPAGTSLQAPLNGEGLWVTETGKLLATGTEINSEQSNGLPYSDVLPGGQITISGGDVILDPGSLADVSGTSGTSTLGMAGAIFGDGSSGISSSFQSSTSTVSSAGGTISITAILGGILEGTLAGKSGGANAEGGTLDVTESGHGPSDDGGPAGFWPAVENTYITIEESINGSYFLSDAQIGTPGTNLANFPQINANIPLSAQMVQNGGFSSLDLTGMIKFSGDGDATLTLPDQIVINSGTITMANGVTDTLNSNYFEWNNSLEFPITGTGTGTLVVNANNMDLAGPLALQGAAASYFTATDDIRLDGTVETQPNGLPLLQGALLSDGLLNFKAGQIYPSTASDFIIASTDEVDFETNGAPPATPLSAGGELQVDSPIIKQFGTLRAPDGTIALGNDADVTITLSQASDLETVNFTVSPTQTLELGSGSLTSVSSAGLTVPFGFTQNGTWYFSMNGSAIPVTVTAPPAKQIVLNSANISDDSGGTIDASGGGDLFAGAFVPGTGGSTDIFAQPNTYAVIPGYLGLAPYDPYIDTGGPGLGKQVYLSGVSGLPAGYYTLLPGQYAELAGAFLVKVQTAPGAGSVATTQTAITPVIENDGSVLMSGYFATPGVGTTDEHWSVFDVMPDTVARKYTEIDNSFANAFFTAQATAAGTTVPRLPQDAGQLSIAATGNLSFEGTGVFTPGTNGLGGLADISASQILVVDAATRDAILNDPSLLADYAPGYTGPGSEDVGGTALPTGTNWDPIVLAASDLNKLGVESLLLGGSRSSNGVSITTTASEVVAANTNDAFVLPEIQMVAAPLQTTTTITSQAPGFGTLSVVTALAGTGQVVIAPGAIIEASGAMAPGDPTSVILSSVTETPPAASDLNIYSPNDIQAYYLEAFENQFGYVRFSGDGLVTIKGGNATYGGLPTGTVPVSEGNFILPTPAFGGSVTVGSGAQLSSDNSLTLFSSGSGTIGANVSIQAEAAELKSTQINLGTDDHTLPGLVLDQTALDGLAAVKTLELVSSGAINLYGDISLGEINSSTGQPVLGDLTLDSGGIVALTAGTTTFNAEQVTFQNTLGGTTAATAQVTGASLVVNAADVLDANPSGNADGMNNATISLGTGAVTLAGFGGGVAFNSTGEIVAIGDGGSLNVQSNLTLNAPEITAGSITLLAAFTNQTPTFNSASYTITAADNAAAPGTYYNVSLINSTGAAPILPTALLGNALTINAGNTSVDTTVELPGGAFNVQSSGDVTIGSTGKVDVSGQSIQFVNVEATIGGGNINLFSTGGAVAVEAGATLDISDLNDVGALNQNTAGTLTLSAPVGGVTVASGTLKAEGPSATTGGSFILDTNSLDSSAPMTYDDFASLLVASGFNTSWNIRVRSGDIAMTGLSAAQSITVSTDTGSIDISGTIDTHGATGGDIELYAGNNLTVESTAVLDAHGATADANGRGGQVWLEAGANDADTLTANGDTGAVTSAAEGTGTLTLNVGAKIDVGADAANSGDSGLVLGGNLTLSTSRNSAGTGVNLTVNGGTLANFLTGVSGESVWDGVDVVGNETYSYNDSTLILTPTTSVAASGGTKEVAFQGYLNDAGTFMANQSGIWSSLGASGSTGVVDINGTSVVVNVRAGINVKNSGDIAIEGDVTNPNGIDLSGSSYAGSVLNTGDTQSLDGHFGQYDEPIVLALRAGGNLNFGVYHGVNNTLASSITLGSLSDGFWQYYSNGTSIVPLYQSEVTGSGASGAATLFDPAASGAYNGLSQGLGADSATYFLVAGADTTAANPLAINNSSAGTMTVTGIPGGSFNPTNVEGGLPTTDPLYIYNNGTNGNPDNLSVPEVTLADFVDYASLVRTGTGSISIATSKDLILQSPLSLIYTAGTGDNINGTVNQPLSGFTQYNGNLTISATTGVPDSLATSVFPTNGGNLTLAVGGNITGDMNASITGLSGGELGEDQNLPYDMTALGSQLKLENFSTAANTAIGSMGGFSSVYATDEWMESLVKGDSYYTGSNVAGTSNGVNLEATPGDYQLAWYTWFPFLENTVGSFGGGNISVKAGGNISDIQFVSPTNARDAGPTLVATAYGLSPTTVIDPATGLAAASQFTGLYVQGGGNVAVQAGGNITDVYTYVQNGSTLMQSGGSISQIALATSTGDVTVEANRTVTIADQQLNPGMQNSTGEPTPFTLSGLSLIQNSSILIDQFSDVSLKNDKGATRENTVVDGILTSIPTGAVTIQAVGDVDIGFGKPESQYYPGQGLVPAQIRAVSLQGDLTNNGDFITYGNSNGTVDLLARGSVDLNQGFVLSDAEPSIMPTLANLVTVLAPFDTTVTSVADVLNTPVNSRPFIASEQFTYEGANYLAGQDPNDTVLEGDQFGQLNPDPTSVEFTDSEVSPTIEAERHAGLHADDPNPVRVYALDGDIVAPEATTSAVNVSEATDIYAGRDILNLAFLGQNNNADDVTSIVAGRDIVYQAPPPAPPPVGTSVDALEENWMIVMPAAIYIGGPGDLIVESGRTVNLGISTGIQSYGNLLDPNLPSEGASITVYTALGTPANLPDYADFAEQFVDPATDASNVFAEPVALFDANGNEIASGQDAYNDLQQLSADQQDILLNRVFFDLLRDSGREHNDVSGDTNYELGVPSLDTVGTLDDALATYQRAFAAIPVFLKGVSGSGDFLGGLSTVRTRDGGNITILAPEGQIQVGLVSPPASFPGYSVPDDATWALNFGIVTEKGGDIDLYANGDITVNQSRVFTLEGGDMTVVSDTGNIDAGKGAKTVLSIQPPDISYDLYGDSTITPNGPASGSGLAVLRALPDAPISNADLIAFQGTINAGDAGIRVSGNISLSAVKVLNASNITVGGKASGIPTVSAPNIGALSSASNASGAASQAASAEAAKHNGPTPVSRGLLASIIDVEVLGYGGGDGDDDDSDPDGRHHK